MLHTTCKLLLVAMLLSNSSQLLGDDGLEVGKPDIKHAGSLAFGPEGTLFVGDSLSAAVFAIDTGDVADSATARTPINIEGINRKIAEMVGSATEDTPINDMVVNPASGNIFLSVSRGRGPDAIPLLFKVDVKGSVTEVSLEKVGFAKTTFDNPPTSGRSRRGRNPRMSAITDIQYTDGKVIVAGLSNEEFASKLRVFKYPFRESGTDTSIEVYHGAHGALETRSPVQTFITYENNVLAAYTCTPLVQIPVGELNGEKIMGKTIAELGNRNKPLDMIVYQKGDQDYLLLSNSSRGVMKMKLSMSAIDAIDAIKSRVSGGGTAGLSFETMEQFQGVEQLDKFDSEHAVLLIANSGSLDLKTVALP
ncbi:MAG: hypothetical protein AAF483_12810 [Planctomycetota bacterium]